MSQRNSEYARIERDAYQTPAWPTDVLADWLKAHVVKVPGDYLIWEPAAGKGQMVDELRRHGFAVMATDIVDEPGADGVQDFLAARPTSTIWSAIVTNPPYKLADQFVRQALALTKPYGLVAMLLKVDFDSAKGRRDLFADCDHFRAKITLTDRIQWFAESTGSPSENHAWFVWDWRWSQHHIGPARVYYAGKPLPISEAEKGSFL